MAILRFVLCSTQISNDDDNRVVTICINDRLSRTPAPCNRVRHDPLNLPVSDFIPVWWLCSTDFERTYCLELESGASPARQSSARVDK